MPNPWITALKKWNEGKDTWCLPKKGSKAYDEVRALMPEKKLKASAEPEKAPAPAPAMPAPSKSKGPKIAPKKPIRGDVEPPAPPMKIPIEPQRKAFSDSMAPKVKFVEPAKKAEPAPKAEAKEKSLYELSPPLVKELKVGDVLNNYRSGGYMGDGGDSRDVGYGYRGKIVKINKDHTIFDVESYKHRHSPKIERVSLMPYPYAARDIQFGKDDWDIPGSKNVYLSNERVGRYAVESTIYRNKEEYDQYNQPLKNYFKSKKNARLDKAFEKRQEMKESKDYEKMSKDDLLKIYDKWSEANMKRLSNIKIAKKDKIIELIKKYNMDE